MKSRMIALSVALAALPLTACLGDGYGESHVAVGIGYPFHGYYDGHYGALHDGYWGSNGFFYFRLSERDRGYRRGARAHFRRGDAAAPGGRFRPMQGHTRPPQGAHMPHFSPPTGDLPRDRAPR